MDTLISFTTSSQVIKEHCVIIWTLAVLYRLTLATTLPVPRQSALILTPYILSVKEGDATLEDVKMWNCKD